VQAAAAQINAAPAHLLSMLKVLGLTSNSNFFNMA
jgi:hypothetical protein